MNTKELNLIKQGILNEIEGYEFYKMASQQSTDEDTKKAFIDLANEEKKHLEWLKELFEKMSTELSDNFQLSYLSDPPSPKLFSWKNLDRSNAGIAMSVYNIGMQMETASIEFYNRAMEETQNPEAKKLYETLITWEKVHFDQFSKEYEGLREGWWEQQGFAPF